jgi:hypothetical protein
VIDNTHLTIEEQFQFVMGHVMKRLDAVENLG